MPESSRRAESDGGEAAVRGRRSGADAGPRSQHTDAAVRRAVSGDSSAA